MDARGCQLRISLIEALVARLPYEPGSMWRARTLLGGEEWMGWSHAERQRADLADTCVEREDISKVGIWLVLPNFQFRKLSLKIKLSFRS